MSLKKLIDDSGKSRYQIAKESGISQGTLQRYYEGKSSVTNMTIGAGLRLSEALAIPFDTLVCEAKKEKNHD